jgi:predicted nucleotidyltransferase
MNEQYLKQTCEELGLIALYLHGSVATGNERPDSDIDFAFLLPHGQDPGPVEDVLLPLLSKEFNRDESEVDLQNLRQAPPHFRVRVLEQGRLLQLGDSTELARFHASSVSEDRDLEHYLRPFRQAMKKRIREGRFAS